MATTSFPSRAFLCSVPFPGQPRRKIDLSFPVSLFNYSTRLESFQFGPIRLSAGCRTRTCCQGTSRGDRIVNRRIVSGEGSDDDDDDDDDDEVSLLEENELERSEVEKPWEEPAICGTSSKGIPTVGKKKKRKKKKMKDMLPERDYTGTPSVPVFVMLPVVMSFHECGGNVGDDVNISLPHWITEIGQKNPDIYFTDREGSHNTDCLSWGIDKERVLKGRTALEVYFDYMRSFRVEFHEFFESGIICEIELGLGPCGELRYPSYPEKHGWKYPGIGEFQCYDKYLMKSLQKAAEARGHLAWAKGPDNAGSYNSWPHKTGFFRDGGDYDSYYGRFFLKWYSKVLIEHGDRVLDLANLAFEDYSVAAKLSGIHWWYKTASHAAELTAGFYNPCNHDGYAAIAAMLKKHGVALNFTCVELRTQDQNEGYPEAMADPEGLVWQVLNAAWDACIPVASENALACFDRVGYNKILENAKPHNDPDGKHLSAFTYLRLGPILMVKHNLIEFERFVKRMHGETVPDLYCPEKDTEVGSDESQIDVG